MIFMNNKDVLTVSVEGPLNDLVRNNIQEVKFINNKYFGDLRNVLISDAVRRNDKTLLNLVKDMHAVPKLSKLQRKITARTYSLLDYINDGIHVKNEIFSNYPVLNPETGKNFYLDIFINKKNQFFDIESDTRVGHDKKFVKEYQKKHQTKKNPDEKRDVIIKSIFNNISVKRLRPICLPKIHTSEVITVSENFTLKDTKELYISLCSELGLFINPDNVIVYMKNNEQYNEEFFMTDEELDNALDIIFKNPEKSKGFRYVLFDFYMSKFKIENFANICQV